MRCHEYCRTGITDRNTIVFRFTTPPSRVRVCLGDVDPMTGKSLDDAGLFRMYHILQNSQAYYSYRDRKAPFTKEQAERRESLRREIAEAFEQDHGYPPGGENLHLLLEERWPTPYTVSLEELTFDDEAVFEKDPRFTCPAAEKLFPGEESDDTEALREFAKSLSGRLLAVYEMMLEKVDAGAGQPQWKELARMWGVSPAQISKDKEKVIGMVREYSRRVRQFSYDKG